MTMCVFADVSLHEELTNPANLYNIESVDRLLLGLCEQPAQKRDEFITEELTNHLFQTPSTYHRLYWILSFMATHILNISVFRKFHSKSVFVQWRPSLQKTTNKHYMIANNTFVRNGYCWEFFQHTWYKISSFILAFV